MFEMLENLDNLFEKKLKKEIQWKEITKLSLQLSPNSAIVLTNLNLYVLKKRLFGIYCYKTKLDEITDIYLNKKLSIKFINKNIKVEVQDNKMCLAKKAIKNINQLIK